MLGSSSQPVTSESASAAYRISGTLSQGGRTWTDTLSQTLQFGQRRDRHRPGLQDRLLPVGAPGDDLVGRGDDLGAGRRRLPRREASWTIDAPNGYQQNARGTDFFIKTPVQAPARTRSRNARSPALAASAWTGC